MIDNVELQKNRLRQQIKEDEERIKPIIDRRRKEQEENERILQKYDDPNYESESDDNQDYNQESEPEEIPLLEKIKKLLGQEDSDDDQDDDIDDDNQESEPDDDDIDEGVDDNAPVDECFTLEDIRLLAQIGQTRPGDIVDREDEIQHAEQMIKKIGGLKGYHIKNNNTTAVANADYMINLLRTYLDTVKNGGSLRRQRRIPYVIGTGGVYGRLRVHLPSLLTHGQLKAFNNGRKVMDAVVDGDTVDILTKKFNPLRQYSEKVKQVFKKLTQLSELPENRLSSKFQFM